MGAHCLEDVHHFYKGGLSFASMNSEKMGMKQAIRILDSRKAAIAAVSAYARFLLEH